MLLVGSFLLSACGGSNQTETSKNIEQTSTSSAAEEPLATFKDGILENEDFKIEYKDAVIINSYQEGKSGIYVTYEFTNKSDENINPYDTIQDYVIMTQENDTSEVDLQNNYYTWDAFEDGNKLAEIEEKGQDDLKPGKTIEAANAFYIDNKENVIKMQMLIDPEGGEYSDPFNIDLSKLKELPEINEDDDEVSSNQPVDENTTQQPSIENPQPGNAEREQAAQDEYWGLIDSGMTDEEASAEIDRRNGVPVVDDNEYYYEDDPNTIYNDEEGYVEIDGERTYYDDEEE